MIFLLAILVLLLHSTNKSPKNRQVMVGDYPANNFPLSGGMSLEVLEKMVEDGLPQHSLDEFATMEDEFLRLEKDTVCGGHSLKIPAVELSRKIKDRFPNYDFSYHNLHIKQLSEPSKAINPWLTC